MERRNVDINSITITFRLWCMICSFRVVVFTWSELKMANSKPKKGDSFSFLWDIFVFILASSTFFWLMRSINALQNMHIRLFHKNTLFFLGNSRWTKWTLGPWVKRNWCQKDPVAFATRAFATPIFVASATPIFVASATPYFRTFATRTAATPNSFFNFSFV